MTLEEARAKIDRVDQELLKLLNERADLVHQVGDIKRKEGLEIFAPDREERLMRKLLDLNKQGKGRLPEKSIRAIYREIISAALALEQDLRIAYLGSRTYGGYATTPLNPEPHAYEGAFAVRRINFFACRQLDFADGQHMFCAFVEQLDDFSIKLINCLTMFGKAHLGKEE
mgnify:CR=1 FL=1